jgi:DNA polymerase III subunit beta
MDFVISRENLLRELQAVQGIVEKKATIPILANIVINARKPGEIEFLATDLEVGLRTSCDAAVAKEGSATLQARRLFDIARLLPDADVRFKVDEGKWVTITCQKARFRLSGLPPEDFPPVKEFDFAKGTPIERDLLFDLIGKVGFAISTDEGRYQITGALTLMHKREVTMVTTDGHRLAMAKGRLEKGSVETRVEMILPRKALFEITRLGGGEKEIQFGLKDNQAFFKLGRTVLSSNLLSGKFPDYEQVIPEGNDRLIKLDSAAFGDVVRRVALLAGERSRAIKLAVSKGSLEVTSSNPEVGDAAETVDIDYGGPDTEVGFNSKYLLDFFQAHGNGQVILALKDESTQGLLRPVGLEAGKDYRYVVMPMRI